MHLCIRAVSLAVLPFLLLVFGPIHVPLKKIFTHMQVGAVPDIDDFRYVKTEAKTAVSTKRVPASSNKNSSQGNFGCFF